MQEKREGMSCKTCKYSFLPWFEEPCSSCTAAYNGYEAINEKKQGMTVRELINKLLDKSMDEEVLLFTKDPKRQNVSGVVFHIDSVSMSRTAPEIVFTDWRDEE